MFRMIARSFVSSLLAGTAGALALLVLPTDARADDAALPTAKPGEVLVHLDMVSEHLEHRANENEEWSFACAPPCDRPLPVGDEYVVIGKDNKPGRPFHLLPKGSSGLTLSARETHGTGLIAGGAVAAVGGTLLLVGGIAWATSSSPSSSSDCISSCDGLGAFLGPSVAVIGGLLLAGSQALIIVGVWRNSAPPVRQDTVALRAPTWTAPTVVASSNGTFIAPLTFSF